MQKETAPPWRVDHATISAMFADAARRAPDRMYAKSPGLSVTYAEAAAAISAIAQDLGPGARGRTVVLVLPNGPAFLLAYFGALAAGAVPALINHAHPDATVAQLTRGLDIAATFSDRTIPGLETRALDVAALKAGSPTGDAPADPAPSDIGAILFSGGTTGLPKQVPHSHTALLSKVERMEWGWPTQDAEIWLPVAPFTHVYGFLMGVLNPVLRAGTVIIPPRFHPDEIVASLADERVTIFGGGPPAIYQALMAAPRFAGARFDALRVCPGGGAPFPLDVHTRWHAATGLPIAEGYGMTEIAPITVNTASDAMKPGAAGKPAPDTVVQIVDVATGQELQPPGATGEVRVKGPHMMTEYTGNPDETAIILREGYVYTGDIGHLDEDGFLTISDRKKDVIFVKGFNVFPREIEEVLMSHADVSSACVVGRPDDRAGERPVAFVTVSADADIATLHAHCAAALADYKCPVDICILDALPMTPAAKVDRSALRLRASEVSE